ncbi:hypothetical protein FZEAL_4392 [Fusarium zealandicum]|uniref:Uncharacterized protein n=1 Tax=Fusarium zealandicum TaxID=1053134 RepID=A0A8H4ULU9_9HYPO|nr:hypothetical protein FZEAL_4392 [Fusarium zealandicum]
METSTEFAQASMTDEVAVDGQNETLDIASTTYARSETVSMQKLRRSSSASVTSALCRSVTVPGKRRSTDSPGATLTGSFATATAVAKLGAATRLLQNRAGVLSTGGIGDRGSGSEWLRLKMKRPSRFIVGGSTGQDGENEVEAMVRMGRDVWDGPRGGIMIRGPHGVLRCDASCDQSVRVASLQPGVEATLLGSKAAPAESGEPRLKRLNRVIGWCMLLAARGPVATIPILMLLVVLVVGRGRRWMGGGRLSKPQGESVMG